MPYTEFCMKSGGSLLNAGTRDGSATEPGTSADLTYAAGSWVNATRVFTVASGDPVADGVAVGDFAALDTGGSTAAYITRVTARTSTTITLHTVGLGTNPANGTYTVRIGGAWPLPSGTTVWPLDQSTLHQPVNAAGNPVRINQKNSADITTSATFTMASNGRKRIQGYTTSYGDGGRIRWTGGTTGASFALFTSGQQTVFANIVSDGNGATGAAHLVTAATRAMFIGCVFKNGCGAGLKGSTDTVVIECEAFGNNSNNTTSIGAFMDGGKYVRCIAHDNTGSNTRGWFNSGSNSCHLVGCISESNGSHGFETNISGTFSLQNCDAYNNGGSGLTPSSASVLLSADSCNFVKNTAWGVNVSAAGAAIVQNCGYGSGTEANGSGTLTAVAGADYEETGSVTYASNVTPWVDPANGDFRINLAAAQGTGRGTFLQTASGYAGAIGYPDIGAAQHQDTGGGGSSRPVHPLFQQVIA